MQADFLFAGLNLTRIIQKKAHFMDDGLEQWFSTWWSKPRGDCLPFFRLQVLLKKILVITSIFYISYMKTLFVVDKIIGSPGERDSLPLHSKLF